MDRMPLRSAAVALALVLALAGVCPAALAAAAPEYSEGRIVVTARWLNTHRNDPHLAIVDVREPKAVSGGFIPGALHMDWRLFQQADAVRGLGVFFVGVDRAQQLLGRSGIRRTDRVVLYDAEKRDGGATAAYVFWVLELLGHPEVMVLERGFEAWTEAGFEAAAAPRTAEAVPYRSPVDELRPERWAGSAFIRTRLGDPGFQILDVRSPDEYLGNVVTPGLDGRPLKAGHIPGAVNIDYRLNWSDPARKTIKAPGDLQRLYDGLDPGREVVVYCLSGRRASFSYFVLRAMGFEKVALYDGSWLEWGSTRLSYPVETRPNRFGRKNG